MPINRLAERSAREDELFRFLRGRPGEIESGLARSAEESAASRGRLATRTDAVTERLAARFNLGAAPVSASGPGFERAAEDLMAREKEELSLRGVREKRENVSRTFSTMTDRLVQAGVDRAQAEAVSRQFALDEESRKHARSEGEKDRGAALEKQNIREDYTTRLVAMQRKFAEDQRASAFKNSLIRSLFGTAAVIGTAYALGPASAPLLAGKAIQTTGEFASRDDLA